MNKEQIIEITELPNAAIIAPAGHGKTEMIADIVAHTSGKNLILTHTNAGVSVIEKRLRDRGISKKRYSVFTIAAFCMKWCYSYPNTASFDVTSTSENQREYYDNLYIGTEKIFSYKWAGLILSSTYSRVVVDEYQDCIQTQHNIILAINKFLSVFILGDPLQGIFYWAGTLVDWNTIEFTNVDVDTKPWRWESTNQKLGEHLTDIRTQLFPILSGTSVQIQIPDCKNCIEFISAGSFDGYKLLRKLSDYSTVLYITKHEYQQVSFSNRMGGIFQNDETQDCKLLYEFAQAFDQNEKCRLALSILDFIKECATSVRKETDSFRKNLAKDSCNFSRIKKHPELGEVLISVCESNSLKSIASVLKWFEEQTCFRFYRKELFTEMKRSVRLADTNQTTINEAAMHIRKDVDMQKRYSGFKFLSSRTVLSKGLEFDCVIVDMRDPLGAKDFYVALTRAKKMVYIISDTSSFTFNP